MSRCAKSPHGRHDFVASKRGADLKCAWCSTRYPCRGSSCTHVDCRIERGDPMPAGVTLLEDAP
jgi:hypothetical protein